MIRIIWFMTESNGAKHVKIRVLNPIKRVLPIVLHKDLSLYDLRIHAGLATDSVNEVIVDLLSQLITNAERQRAAATGKDKTRHSRRVNSFIAARDAIKDYKPLIKSGSQAKKEIPHVGKGIADRIDEFLRTGRLQELDAEISPTEKIILDLSSVTGIGQERALILHRDFGVTSVADLISKYHQGIIKVKPNQLTHHIAVGLQYYYDIQVRMSWAEADQIATILKATVHALDPRFIITVCGSYRRMRPTCGDIDVLISHPDIDGADTDALRTIVRALSDVGLLVGHLTADGDTKYMGICKTDTLGRRIDIRFVSHSSLGAATLYFTGSCKFNKIMRYQANVRGFTLNEYGLFQYHNGVRGDLVPAVTERDIFDILQFLYIDPTEREF